MMDSDTPNTLMEGPMILIPLGLPASSLKVDQAKGCCPIKVVLWVLTHAM